MLLLLVIDMTCVITQAFPISQYYYVGVTDDPSSPLVCCWLLLVSGIGFSGDLVGWADRTLFSDIAVDDPLAFVIVGVVDCV